MPHQTHANRSRRTLAAPVFALALSALVSAAVIAYRGGGGAHPAAAAVAPQASPRPSPSTPATRTQAVAGSRLTAAQANELGRVPILMYHSVGDPPMKGALGRLIRRHGLSIAPDLLRKHLQTLYDGGFYPVNMRDLLSPRLDIPAGKTPVVLTFDDARTSQFRYRKDGSIDPNCVVGILEAFHRKHPDWPERASFYVLPESSINPAPFGNQRQVKKKLDYLVAHGYEIANHSTTHHPMRHMDARALSWEMATCTAYFRKVEPRATMDTMALPYGIAPRKALLPVLLNDGKGGGGYRNRCILLAAGNPSYAPADKRFDRLGVMRVGSDPGNIEHWIKVLTAQRTAAARTGAGYAPYVSDGDPNTLTVPQPLAKYVNQSSLEGVRVVYTAPPRKATHVAKRN